MGNFQSVEVGEELTVSVLSIKSVLSRFTYSLYNLQLTYFLFKHKKNQQKSATKYKQTHQYANEDTETNCTSS